MASLLSAWCDSRRASCRIRSASPSSPFMTLSCREQEKPRGRSGTPRNRAPPGPGRDGLPPHRGTTALQPDLGFLQQEDDGVLVVLLGVPGEEREGCGARVTPHRPAPHRPRRPPHLPGSPGHPRPAGPTAAARTPSCCCRCRRHPPPRGRRHAGRCGAAGAPRGSAGRPSGTTASITPPPASPPRAL